MLPLPAIAPDASIDAPAGSVGRFRWTICGLLFFATAINYIDRQVIGILKPSLSHDLSWSETDYANIVSAFQLAYAIAYLVGGRVMDHIGVKRGLSGAVLFWSLAAGAHGVVRSVAGFATARFSLGLAEGGYIPGAVKTVTEWFPAKERALATGIFNCGSNVGAVLCPLTVPWITLRWGWPAAFYVTGALGFCWLIAWALLYDAPAVHPRLSLAERSYILDRADAPEIPQPSTPWRVILRERTVWGFLAANILCGPVWAFYLFWLPDFLQKRFHLSLAEIGRPLAVFYIVTSLGGVAGGFLTPRLINRGWTVITARKLSLAVCAGCVVPVFLTPLLANVWLSIAVVGLAGAAHFAWSVNLYSLVSDYMPKQAIASVIGLGGLLGSVTGIAMAKVVGAVLEASGSYVPLFVVASVMYPLAWSILHVLLPRSAAPDAGSNLSR